MGVNLNLLRKEPTVYFILVNNIKMTPLDTKGFSQAYWVIRAPEIEDFK